MQEDEMRRYLINSKEVTKQEWTTAYQNNPQASVILKTRSNTNWVPPETNPISPEKLKLIKKDLLQKQK